MTKIIKKYFLHEKILAIALIFTATIQIVTLIAFISINQKTILKIDTETVVATLIKQAAGEDIPDEQVKDKIKDKIKKLDDSLSNLAQKNNGLVINSKAVVAGGVDITKEVITNLQEDK